MLPNSNVSIHTHPSRRTKAERDLIQGGFAPNLPRILSRMYPGVISRKATSLKVPCQLHADRRQFTSSLRTYFACRLQRCSRGFPDLGCMGDSTAFLMTGSKRANHGWAPDTSLSSYKMINRQLLKNGLPVCAASSQYSKANEHSP